MNVPEPLITLPDVSGVMMAGVFKLEVHPASFTNSETSVPSIAGYETAKLERRTCDGAAIVE